MILTVGKKVYSIEYGYGKVIEYDSDDDTYGIRFKNNSDMDSFTWYLPNGILLRMTEDTEDDSRVTIVCPYQKGNKRYKEKL